MKKSLLTLASMMVASPVYADNIGVYIIAGQSNASGFAQTTDPMSTFERRVLAPNDDVYYRPTTGQVQDLQPVENHGAMTFGPELSFGNYIPFRSAERVAIVKYAVGSTDLEEDWDPDTGSMYALMMNRTLSTLNYLESLGHSPTIKGFNWIQGEEDARVQNYALNYESNLEDLFNSVREDLSDPTLPIVLARINAPGRLYRDLVRDAQVEVAESMEGISWIDTDSLPLRDAVHYSGKGQYELGKDFAEAYGVPHSGIRPPANVPWQNQSAIVPEPSTVSLLLMGAIALFGIRRR